MNVFFLSSRVLRSPLSSALGGQSCEDPLNSYFHYYSKSLLRSKVSAVCDLATALILTQHVPPVGIISLAITVRVVVEKQDN